MGIEIGFLATEVNSFEISSTSLYTASGRLSVFVKSTSPMVATWIFQYLTVKLRLVCLFVFVWVWWRFWGCHVFGWGLGSVWRLHWFFASVGVWDSVFRHVFNMSAYCVQWVVVVEACLRRLKILCLRVCRSN